MNTSIILIGLVLAQYDYSGSANQQGNQNSGSSYQQQQTQTYGNSPCGVMVPPAMRDQPVGSGGPMVPPVAR